MYIRKSDGPRAVTLADGTIMTRADLPAIDTTRWAASRKIAVVRAVAGGLISREWALSTYDLSEDEFLQWEDAVARHGAQGLKTTRLQEFR